MYTHKAAVGHKASTCLIQNCTRVCEHTQAVCSYKSTTGQHLSSSYPCRNVVGPFVMKERPGGDNSSSVIFTPPKYFYYWGASRDNTDL